MDCIIHIAGGIAYRQSNQTEISRFSVFGVAVGCSDLTVTLTAGTQQPLPPVTVNVSVSGAWSAEFDMAQSGLTCSDTPTSIDVDAVCNSDTSCSAHTKFDNYTCQIVDTCPAFEKFGAVAVDTANGGCNTDGERQVELSATLMGQVPSGQDVTAQFYMENLETGDEEYFNAETLTPQVPYSSDKHVPPGTYLYQLRVISPQPCPGPIGVLEVLDCPQVETGTVCPLVIMGDENISEACTPNGQRTVGLSATVTPEPGHPVDAVLRVESGGTDFGEIDSRQGLASETVLSGSRPLPPGDYTAVLEVTSPDSCNSSGANFTVLPCETGDEPDRIPGEPDDPTGEDTPGGDDTIPTRPDTPPPEPGGVNWCLILFWSGFALFLIGAIAVGVGFCAVGIAVHPIWVGIWAIVINFGMVMLILGTLLLTIWIFLCGSCRINCDALKWFRDALIVLDVVFALLAAFGGAIVAASPLCFIGWMIDVGFTSYLLLLAHFWVFFTGCERYSDWWPDWLQFTMPDSLRAHCGRDG